MAKLAYIPETLVRPREKPGVYLAIHPADRPLWFETLVKEIRGAQDCVVWFDEEPEEPWDEELHLSDMEEMNLIVFPVTTRFLLQPNRAREAELPHAMKQRIPILPIMMETGLEELFERCFGDVQYLDRAKIDLTAIPYAEKLKNFLASILVGDELAAQVRAAFDAYIFLSYRKKDRKEAQELMRLIHQNDFCQSVAIWYDEFLVPGENFNGAIEAALRKSHLFALAVTPNLTERPNYVELYEYPKAKDAGVPVIPVQMAPTVRSTLETAFPGIPEDVDGRDSDALSVALLAGLRSIALRTKGNDPQHTYFMGLAYLNGIDVEVDRTRGVELITQAADAGLPEGMGKLVTMYRTGEGVERDYMEAIRWQEKLTDYWKDSIGKSVGQEYVDEYFVALWDLGSYWYELRNLREARLVYLKIMRICETQVTEMGTRESCLNLALSLQKMGELSQEESDFTVAREYYLSALKVYEALTTEGDMVEIRENLSVLLAQMGDLSSAERDLTAAREYYRQTAKLFVSLWAETGEVKILRELSTALSKIGELSLSEGDLASARKYYQRSLEIFESLAVDYGTVRSLQDLWVSLHDMGELSQAEGDIVAAKEYFRRALETAEEIADEIGTEMNRQSLCISLSSMGELSQAEGDIAAAREYYQQALELSEHLTAERGTAWCCENLSVTLGRMGDLNLTEGDFATAKEYWQQALEIDVGLATKTGTRDSLRRLSITLSSMGELSRAEGDLVAAREYYRFALEGFEVLAAEKNTIESRQDLFVALINMGQVCLCLGDENPAIACFERAEEIEAHLP